VRSGIPIYAETELLNEVGKPASDETSEDAEEIIDDFKQFIDSISPEDFQG
jgi:bifunctional DNase/RNase